MFCPKCKADAGHRSHRRNVRDFLLSLFGWYPYRCKCGHRFSQRRDFVLPAGTSVKMVESEIRTTRAAALRSIRRRELLLFGGALLLFAAFLYYLTRERAPTSDGN